LPLGLPLVCLWFAFGLPLEPRGMGRMAGWLPGRLAGCLEVLESMVFKTSHDNAEKLSNNNFHNVLGGLGKSTEPWWPKVLKTTFCS